MIENEKSSEPDFNGQKIVAVTLDQLMWPFEVNELFPVEIINWLVSDDLSDAVLDIAANMRIHIIPKPRTKKTIYLVVGGFIPFLLLNKAQWNGPIRCVLDESIAPNDLLKHFYLDVSLGVFPLKAGPVGTAAKAAVFVKLLELGERNSAPSCFKLMARHLSNGKTLLNQLVGFDPRSYRRSDKTGVDTDLLSQIEEILQIRKPESTEEVTTKIERQMH